MCDCEAATPTCSGNGSSSSSGKVVVRGALKMVSVRMLNRSPVLMLPVSRLVSSVNITYGSVPPAPTPLSTSGRPSTLIPLIRSTSGGFALCAFAALRRSSSMAAARRRGGPKTRLLSSLVISDVRSGRGRAGGRAAVGPQSPCG